MYDPGSYVPCLSVCIFIYVLLSSVDTCLQRVSNRMGIQSSTKHPITML